MSQTFMAKPSLVRFNILVVDDDSTSLSIVSAMLKHWDYDVVTVKRPVEALARIRIHQDIDIVITDLHMPEMNGLELQQQINEEFNNLPVMIMSSDDRESVIMKALASGVVFYLVKPLNPTDLKNVWQYAVTSKNGKSIYTEENGSFEGAAGSSAEKLSVSSGKEQKKNKKDSKRKASKNGKVERGRDQTDTSTKKKAKVAWTNSLHNRFLQAIRHISLERAVPKTILEFMNVPGLTRENVASHLQKYRIFLKRVAERGAGAASKNFTHRSSFATAHSAMMLQEAQFREQQQEMMRSSPFLPGYGGGISTFNGAIMGSLGLRSLGASSTNSVSHQLGLLGNQANFQQSLFGNTASPLYQANSRSTFGTGSNGDLMNGTNSNHMYQKKCQSRPYPFDINIGASSFKGFGTSGWNPSYISGRESIGTINNNPSGIQLNDDVAAGQTSLSGNGLNGGNGLINGTASLMGSTAFHHSAPGGPSSSAFAHANEQANTSVVPPLLSQQQYDFTNSGLMNNGNASVTGNTAQPEQFGESIDIDEFLFDPSDYQYLFQQGGGEGATNPNFASASDTNQADPNLPIIQPQDYELSGIFSVDDNARSPWNEPTLEQFHEIEQVLNPELSSNAANAYPLYGYFPSFDQNPNPHGNQNNLNNSELNGLNPRENFPSGNQVWDEEFIDSLLQNDPY